MIASRSSMADGFSILARTAARSPTSLRTSCTSSARCTNDSAIQSTPIFKSAPRSARSFSVSGPTGSRVSGRLMPLRLDSAPPASTSAAMRVVLLLDDAHAQLAVVEQQHVPRLDGLEDLRVRQEHALRRARLLGAVEAEDGAVVDEHAAAGEFADAELRPLQVGQHADRVAMALGDPTHGILQRARRLVRGMAHVDAEHVDAREEQAFDHFRGRRGRA